MKAVISVFDKDKVVAFAKALNELGLKIIATAEIGIVVVNLIPPDLTVKNTLDSMDIGGVAMLRSGIKNFENVAVIVTPSRYDEIIEELRQAGKITRDTRLSLANEASKYLLEYDTKIVMLLERMK